MQHIFASEEGKTVQNTGSTIETNTPTEQMTFKTLFTLTVIKPESP